MFFFDGRWKLILTTLGAFEEDACVRVLPRTPSFNVGGALQGDMQLRTFPSTTLNLGDMGGKGEGGVVAAVVVAAADFLRHATPGQY